MSKHSWMSAVTLLLALVAISVALSGCSERPPEERLAMNRARYEASLNGFLVEQQPIEAEGTGDGGDDGESVEDPAADAEAPGGDDGESGGSEATEEEPVALRQDVLIDVVIRHESFEKLDGITVDITMADGERELQVWRVWFDTSAIEKGPGAQFSHILENVDYQPGYGFSAEIRHPVPLEERSQYREFSDLGG